MKSKKFGAFGLFTVLMLVVCAMGADLRLPSGVVGDREVTSSDGQQISSTKLYNEYEDTERFGHVIGGTPTTQEVILFTAQKAGTIVEVGAGLNDSGTSTNVTYDLKKNGTTMLTGAISVVHGTGDRVTVNGTLASADYDDGDVISVLCTATSTTGAQGPFIAVKRRERGA